MTDLTVLFGGAVGIIEMNNETRRNVLSQSFLDKLSAAFEQCDKERSRVVILRARRGSRVWSAGHDVEELPGKGIDPLGHQDPLPRFTRFLEAFPIPVIASIEGSVWGGACQVAFSCDLVISASDATFAFTPARLGVPYHLQGLATFVHCVGPQVAREMAFTGLPLSADRLYQLGAINQIVASWELERATIRLAHNIAANAPLAIGSMKEQIRALLCTPPMSAAQQASIESARRLAYSSNDYDEGIAAFKSKRKPQFDGK